LGRCSLLETIDQEKAWMTMGGFLSRDADWQGKASKGEFTAFFQLPGEGG